MAAEGDRPSDRRMLVLRNGAGVASWPTTGTLPAADPMRGGRPEIRAVGRRTALLCLHVGWAVLAGAAVLLIGYGVAALLAPVLPVPRRTVLAGGVVLLALSAGWLGPTVVGRVTRYRLGGR